jgi:hypothetical protein
MGRLNDCALSIVNLEEGKVGARGLARRRRGAGKAALIGAADRQWRDARSGARPVGLMDSQRDHRPGSPVGAASSKNSPPVVMPTPVMPIGAGAPVRATPIGAGCPPTAVRTAHPPNVLHVPGNLLGCGREPIRRHRRHRAARYCRTQSCESQSSNSQAGHDNSSFLESCKSPPGPKTLTPGIYGR